MSRRPTPKATPNSLATSASVESVRYDAVYVLFRTAFTPMHRRLHDMEQGLGKGTIG